jgi:hypothetical protein
MSMKPANTKLQKLALLILISGGIGVILYWVLPPLGSSIMSLGGALLAIGTFNILFHRGIGRQFFRQSTSSPQFFASFWESVGEGGAQLLYFGIGTVLATIGSVFMIIGVAGFLSSRF